MSFVYTSMKGDNSELIAAASSLHMKDGEKVADITFGKGIFWKKVNTARFIFYKSDKMTVPGHPYDFTKLPYVNAIFNHVVFDPPYVHNPGKLYCNGTYQNAETTKAFYHKDIIQLYRYGMKEGHRCLKPNGMLWVKCKDEIESSKQYMSHIEIHDYATKDLGMTVKDLFVLTCHFAPVQIKAQQHARKNHSYLWLFKKTL